jgi:hypothetical protein
MKFICLGCDTIVEDYNFINDHEHYCATCDKKTYWVKYRGKTYNLRGIKK